MSFALVKLTALANTSDISTWSYETDDELQDLAGPDYFIDVKGMLRRGDLIFASCLQSGVRKTVSFLVDALGSGLITRR